MRFLTVLAFCTCLLPVQASAQHRAVVGNSFFPLAVGHSWSFCDARPTKGRAQCEVWSISDRLKDGYILQVNPSEDDISILSEQDGDIVDLDSGYHILMSKSNSGDTWKYPEYNSKNKKVQFVEFSIAYKGKCTFLLRKDVECVTVSKYDPVVGIYETVTYAEAIGPIRIKTYSLDRRRTFADFKIQKYTLSDVLP